MNWNSLRTWFDIIAGINGGLVVLLLNAGCTDVGNTISCTAANLPTWLAPWAAIIALVATGGRFAVKAMTGANGLFGKERTA